MSRIHGLLIAAVLSLAGTVARADSYTDTVTLFKNAGQSASFFKSCYGYAVFPTIGKGGFVVGAAHGSGRVYEHAKYVGDSSVTQLSVGFQAGGQAYSQIIFLRTGAHSMSLSPGISNSELTWAPWQSLLPRMPA